MIQLPHLLIPVAILATAGATLSPSNEISHYGETIGIVSILAYFLWDKTSECKQLKAENKKLLEKLSRQNKQDDSIENKSNQQQ